MGFRRDATLVKSRQSDQKLDQVKLSFIAKYQQDSNRAKQFQQNKPFLKSHSIMVQALQFPSKANNSNLMKLQQAISDGNILKNFQKNQGAPSFLSHDSQMTVPYQDKIQSLLQQLQENKIQFSEMMSLMPVQMENDPSGEGWPRIYKMLISPFSNRFKKYIETELQEKQIDLLQRQQKELLSKIAKMRRQGKMVSPEYIGLNRQLLLQWKRMNKYNQLFEYNVDLDVDQIAQELQTKVKLFNTNVNSLSMIDLDYTNQQRKHQLESLREAFSKNLGLQMNSNEKQLQTFIRRNSCQCPSYGGVLKQSKLDLLQFAHQQNLKHSNNMKEEPSFLDDDFDDSGLDTEFEELEQSVQNKSKASIQKSLFTKDSNGKASQKHLKYSFSKKSIQTMNQNRFKEVLGQIKMNNVFFLRKIGEQKRESKFNKLKEGHHKKITSSDNNLQQTRKTLTIIKDLSPRKSRGKSQQIRTQFNSEEGISKGEKENLLQRAFNFQFPQQQRQTKRNNGFQLLSNTLHYKTLDVNNEFSQKRDLLVSSEQRSNQLKKILQKVLKSHPKGAGYMTQRLHSRRSRSPQNQMPVVIDFDKHPSNKELNALNSNQTARLYLKTSASDQLLLRPIYTIKKHAIPSYRKIQTSQAAFRYRQSKIEIYSNDK